VHYISPTLNADLSGGNGLKPIGEIYPQNDFIERSRNAQNLTTLSLFSKKVFLAYTLICLFAIAASAECVYIKQLQASQKEQDNVLTWATLTETNSAFFLIERSLNGIHFEEAGRVEGAGNSLETKQYSFTDINNQGMRVFYRLAEVNMEGIVQFTNLVLVNRKGEGAVFEISAIESSVTQQYFNMTLTSTVAAPLEYRLQTKMGVVLKKGMIDMVVGQNALSVDLHDTEAGSYQFSIRIKNEIEVIALQKVDEAVNPESILSVKEKE
jgi:hypothetical protein